MATLVFSKLPHPIKGSDVTVSPFKIDIPEDDIKNLKTLLKLLPIARPNFENSKEDGEYGVSRKWVVDSVNYWQNGYDWRKQEEILNSIPQFKAKVKDDDGLSYDVHFAALFSENKDAIPILITHGWPGTFIEVVPIIQKLQKQYGSTPEKLPYHIIAPSLSGFGFSSPPTADLKRVFTMADNSRLINKVMVALGFGEHGYIAQGGDLGSMLSESLAVTYPECKAYHQNLWKGISNPPYDPAKHPPTNDVEKATVERTKEFRTYGSAYSLLHATKPSTAGLALGSSPIAVLAWIGEKMTAWADPRTQPSMDEILTNVSIFWFTGTYPSSIWSYTSFRAWMVDRLQHDKLAALPPSGKPSGYSWFPNEIVNAPRSYFTENKIYTHFYAHDKGGHFAQLEVPDLIWADIEDFVAKVWKK